GNDDIGALPGTHGAGADADPADLSQKIAYLYGVADVDRTFEKQDQAGDKIVHHALEPEPDANAERSCQNAHLGEVYPERRHAQDKPKTQNRVVQQARDGVRQAALDPDPWINILL